MKRKGLFFPLFLVLVILAGVPIIYYSSARDLPVIDGIGGDFTLTGPGGRPFALSETRGKVVMVTFGYTHCPDVCPATLLQMKRLMARLGEAGENFRVLFVTLDPERDTAEVLTNYVGFFGPWVTGLTGSLDQIQDVTGSYRTFFKKSESGSKAGYLVAHSDFVYLLDHLGRTRVIYHYNEPLEKMVEDAKLLLADIP